MAHHPYSTELAELRLDLGALYASLIRIRTQILALVERVDGLMYGPPTNPDDMPTPPTAAACRHLTPIGDYCAYCQEAGADK